ncbi:hypothetical protein H4R99_007919 [Coemansia sp. RSA 1722]|nr:hypothetical protein LPJ57_004366 [Coemansia sp. RSA 486]KAJ2232692.1 hypothetical protein IWW45_004774 [Coemansia sp. RSA 485]KAJ2588121.1 hypothetical protein H4R99_007919 [Coemansia sp. RSA 1722]
MSSEAVSKVVSTLAVEADHEKHYDEKDMVWYLGYGSNMSSEVLSGRRQVFPVKSLPVVVPGYQLTFDMAGIPYVEPGFGTIMPVDRSNETADKANGQSQLLLQSRKTDCQAGSPLHCIAHLITKKEFAHIINTEGGSGNPDFGYQVLEVACKTYDGQSLKGMTLIDYETKVSCYHPSQRYRNIILNGAEEHNLAPEYIERLKMVKPYVAETAGQRFAKYLVIAIGVPFALPLLLSAISALVFKTKTPRPVALYGEWFKHTLWWLHDRVLAPVFGKGC